MAGNLEPHIEANIQGPKKATGDGHSMEQHSIPDMIEGDKYLCNKGAIGGGKKSLFRKMIARFQPPGSI